MRTDNAVQMASFTPSTAAAETHHNITGDATGKDLANAPAPRISGTPAASDRANLPNVWRDSTNDKEASEGNSPAPEYPRVPFTPIAYKSNDFPMLRPIQHFTDAQVHAIKSATAEAKKKERSERENGK